MLNRRSLAWLALATLVLFIASAAIGQDNDFLVVGDDIIWVAFLLCAATLIISSIVILIQSALRSRR